MNSNDVKVILGLIIAQGYVEWFGFVDLRHHQTLWKGFGSWAFLDDFALVNDCECKRSGDTALLGSDKRVVAPFDASSAGG